MEIPNWTGSKVGRSHPTRDLLIEKTIELLETMSPDEITSDLVLKESGISKGSLYHHFVDFPELLEFSYAEIFSRLAERQISALRDILRNSRSQKEFLQGIRAVTHGNLDPALVSLRLARITSISNALTSSRMGVLIGLIQQNLTSGLADFIREVQERGWANPDLDPFTVSVFVQAYQVGSVVDLLTPKQVNFEGWVNLVDQVLELVILAPSEA